jgi:dihydrofolate reductase
VIGERTRGIVQKSVPVHAGPAKGQKMRQLIAIGSLSVVKALLEAGLVDRLRLMVFP